MFFFLLILSIFLITIGILLLGMLIFRKYRRRIEKKLRGIMKDTFFNGIIRSLNMTYLKSFVAFALAMSIVKWDFS